MERERIVLYLDKWKIWIGRLYIGCENLRIVSLGFSGSNLSTSTYSFEDYYGGRYHRKVFSRSWFPFLPHPPSPLLIPHLLGLAL
jgi:hypothetical protein